MANPNFDACNPAPGVVVLPAPDRRVPTGKTDHRRRGVLRPENRRGQKLGMNSTAREANQILGNPGSGKTACRRSPKRTRSLISKVSKDEYILNATQAREREFKGLKKLHAIGCGEGWKNCRRMAMYDRLRRQFVVEYGPIWEAEIVRYEEAHRKSFQF